MKTELTEAWLKKLQFEWRPCSLFKALNLNISTSEALAYNTELTSVLMNQMIISMGDNGLQLPVRAGLITTYFQNGNNL